MGRAENNNIAIHVTPPDAEEDDEFAPAPALRMRRKLSTPLSALPNVGDGFMGLPSEMNDNFVDFLDLRDSH